MQISLIPHMCENSLVMQRAHDGYINATAMCQATGKQFHDYFRIGPTQAFLSELESETGIPVSELVISIKGGDVSQQGTWVHPQVAINLGQWCSAKFAVAVSRWVMEWTTGQVKIPGLPYHVSRYLANRSEVPPTHFSMLNEMLFALIAPLEEAGYTMPDHMIPDISMGRMFCAWLRKEKGIDTDVFPVYPHTYANGKQVMAKLYPNELLADVRLYFRDKWMPERAMEYFKERDPAALPHLPKLLGPAAQDDLPLPPAARYKPRPAKSLPPKK